MVEEMCKRMLWCTIVGLPHQQIFDWVTISIFYNEKLCIWQQLLGCDGRVATVSYSIGIVGAVHLWEAADPKFVSEFPCFTFIE